MPNIARKILKVSAHICLFPWYQIYLVSRQIKTGQYIPPPPPTPTEIVQRKLKREMLKAGFMATSGSKRVRALGEVTATNVITKTLLERDNNA